MFEVSSPEERLFALAGHLDNASCPLLEECLDQICQTSVLDFSQLEYISSSGLGCLVRAQKRLLDQGQELRIINANEFVGKLFRYAGLHQIFSVQAQPRV